MSVIRAALTVVEAVAYQMALTPPNPTPKKGRYHTEAPYILQIAPLIFWVHQVVLWIFAFFETLLYLSTITPLATLSPYAPHAVCPVSSPSVPQLLPTPLFLIGAAFMILGCMIRLECFRSLGELFTFDLTVHPEHRLVTTGFYGWVRHPAYTGSMLLVAGIAISHLTPGSWAAECTFGDGYGAYAMYAFWGLWWFWTASVGISRARAEDKQMKILFGEEWDSYAAEVPWWFLPGLL
ncbi:hypothetical protein CPB85DRAFT_1219383 [Mucidula mucida]|nr:hypothetical protein CPB85DRAFT_1219383 [Mucidula mucida]